MLFSGRFDPVEIIMLTIAFMAGIAIHEGNHALVATALGDDTPKQYGRLSLNPMRHIDIAGIVTFVILGFGWGWTPVTPAKLRPNPIVGNAMVAAAGPLANLALAYLLSLPLRAGVTTDPLLHAFLYSAVALNLLLFAFNLLPIPPLDGFTVLLGFLPRHLATSLKRLEPYGAGIIFAMFILPSLFGSSFSLVGMLFRPVSMLFGLPQLR